MPEVQNVGAVDYAQYQPSQYQGDAYTESYNSQPEVYNEQMAEIQAANKSRKGSMILTTTIIGGLGLLGGYFIGKHGKASKSDLEAVKKQLEELKNSDAVKNYEKAQEALEQIEQMANDGAGKFFGANRCGFGLKNTIEKLVKPFKKNKADNADNAIKKAEEAAEKTGEEVKDTIANLEDTANDAVK